jgi:hypothetical protein
MRNKKKFNDLEKGRKEEVEDATEVVTEETKQEEVKEPQKVFVSVEELKTEEDYKSLSVEDYLRLALAAVIHKQLYKLRYAALKYVTDQESLKKILPTLDKLINAL